MTTLRTAAQQALEAMEKATRFMSDSDYRKLNESITALKAALAEPVQEPDLSRCPKCNGPADNGHDRSIPPSPYFCTKCMAEPVQEPVAWEQFHEHMTGPFYRAPPQRKPLSEEEIYKMYNEPRSDAEMVDFARAIERAHGIGDDT